MKNAKKSSLIQLYGEVSMAQVTRLESLLAECARRGKPVTISLFTEGGSVAAGLAIYDLIQYYQDFFPIDILAIGQCMSMGVVVLQAARERLAFPHTRFMVHGVQSLLGKVGMETKTDKAEGRNKQAMIDEILARRTRITQQQLARCAKARTEIYYDTSEALAAGIIDRVLGPERAASAARHALALAA